MLISQAGLTHAQVTADKTAFKLVPIIGLLLDEESFCRGELEELSDMQPNSTLRIECLYNLQLASIALPMGARLEFAGGSILNGSLVFSGGTIDGELLNYRLDVTGDAQLTDPIFAFNPTSWGIGQGRVSKAQALRNRVNINRAMDQIRPLGAHTMELGKLDAFFEVGWRRGNRLEQSRVSIRIPSNFHFKMSDETYLRVQPNDQPAYSLLNLYVTDNSIVSGGHLVGDRYEHQYVSVDHPGAHEFGSALYVIGSHNTLIENVDASNATGESLIVHAQTIRNADGTLAPGTRTTENLVVRGGSYRDSRRNNIAVIDADGVIFDGISVLRAGEGETLFDANGNKVDSSAGTAPRYGMDLEANRLRNEDGTLNEINRITDITVRNSSFDGNAKGDIDVYTASNVLIEKNYFTAWVANFASNDVTVQDNVFEHSGEFDQAILVQSFINSVGEQVVSDWRILRNTIRNYPVGIAVSGRDMTVSENRIYQAQNGILMKSLIDSTISNNVIESTLPVSYGHSPTLGTTLKNVVVTGEQINVRHRPLNLRNINETSTATIEELTYQNCVFKSNSSFPVYLIGSKNIKIANSEYTNDISVNESENIELDGNTLISP